MRTLFIDIETSPNVVYTWGLFKQNVGINQIIEPTRVLCAAYSWGDGNVKFTSEWSSNTFVADLWELLDEADAVVHYNGKTFDVPHIQREFLEGGFKPPSPFAQIDLYSTVKRKFRFPSGKLAWVSRVLELGGEGKISTDMTLWTGVMNEEKAARSAMRDYNMQDVVLLEELYGVLLPWIPDHPNRALWEGTMAHCVACGSDDLERRGYSYTMAGTYQRFVCRTCGKWQRDAKRTETTDLRPIR